MARWQARLFAFIGTSIVLAGAAAVATVVVAVRSPELLVGDETHRLRAELSATRDSLRLARATEPTPDSVAIESDALTPAATILEPAARGVPRPLLGRRPRPAVSVPDAFGAPRESRSLRELPVAGLIASRFSRARRHPILRIVRPHLGVDVSAPSGTRISAPASGRVVFAGRRFAFGLVVEIDHGRGVITRYAHCRSVQAHVGQQVDKGARIATVGSTGLSSGPHLHYEVLVGGRHVDPLRYHWPPAGYAPNYRPVVERGAGAVVETLDQATQPGMPRTEAVTGGGAPPGR